MSLTKNAFKWTIAPALGLALCTQPVSSASLPAAQTQVSIVARDQPIAAFISDLFGRIGRPVVTSSNLTGTINGTFTGSVDKVFSDVAKAFNLVGYFDGAAIYIYAASELSVQTLNVGSEAASRVVAQVRAQRLSDARNLVRKSSDGTLVVSGTPRFIEQVSGLANGTAAAMPGGGNIRPGMGGGFGGAANPAATPLEFRVFYLKYARAEDTTVAAGGREVRVPGLATIIQNLVLDQRPGGNQTFGSRPIRQSQPRLKGQGLDAITPDVSQTPVLGLPTGGYYPGQQTTLDSGYGAAPLTTDIVRIEPNPYLNALIVRDVPERMAAYDSLIRALDVEPQLVEVEATIIDIDTNKLRELGINWRLATGGFGALFGGDGDGTAGSSSSIDANNRLLPNFGTTRRNNTNNIPLPGAAGGTISTIIGSQRQFLSRITALEQKGAARIVSRPQVMTLSNVEAVFDRTSTFYVRVAGREEVDLFNVTAGTVLRVNPHVFRDQDQTRIRVLVNIEDGSISDRSLVENIPIVDRSSVSTQAMVLDGESLLLGGMATDSDYDNVSKIPLLGDIPLLGNLFKTRTKNRSHTERLFLISPHVATLTQRLGPVAVSAMSNAGQPVLTGTVRQPLPAPAVGAMQPMVQPLPAPTAPPPAPAKRGK